MLMLIIMMNLICRIFDCVVWWKWVRSGVERSEEEEILALAGLGEWEILSLRYLFQVYHPSLPSLDLKFLD